MIVRPVRSSDLPALIDLARSTGTGLTTLPANEERLTHRVGWAEKTFRGEAGRGDADYLFVLENDKAAWWAFLPSPVPSACASRGTTSGSA